VHRAERVQLLQDEGSEEPAVRQGEGRPPLSDEYASTIAADFNAPAMVCAPVDLGNGVADASVTQCCYKVGTQGLTKPRPQVRTSGGRFTGSQLEVLKSQLICEPCAADLLP
jgi:hypothetical protein